MIEIKNDALVFSFPDVHPEARCSILFQRTLRIPEGGGKYPVPPGLGRFPLTRVDDYGASAPENWTREGSAFLPMFQAEALYVIFLGRYPFAIKVTVGGVNAFTGKRLRDERLWRPRDYMVVPRNPWMEWDCIGNGKPRQVVALPIGKKSREKEQAAGIKIMAHPMKEQHYREFRRRRETLVSQKTGVAGTYGTPDRTAWETTPAEDGGDYGFGAWKLEAGARAVVYPVNSRSFVEITGQRPPGRPPGANLYSEAGIPWCESYGADREIPPSGYPLTS